MSKFTYDERSLVKNIIATLTIKRIDDNDIIKVITDQTGKSITRKEIWNIRERIKRESYHWHKTMREGEFEYIHEVKERINEILSYKRSTINRIGYLSVFMGIFPIVGLFLVTKWVFQDLNQGEYKFRLSRSENNLFESN